MLNVSQEYLTSVDNYIRTKPITRIYFNGSTTPMVDEIMSATVSEVGQSTDSITIGDLCTNSATVKFTMPTEVIPLENGYFKLEVGIEVDGAFVYTPMGTYYISEVESVEGSNQYTVKGFDRSTRLDKDYAPTVTLPTTVEKVVKDICTQCKITLATYTFPNIAIETIYEGTCKDNLKYMAGLMGKNAKIDRYDKLTFYWFGVPVHTITQDIQFMNGYTKTTEEDIVISSLTSGSEENTLVSGNGRGISFENPYMTQSLLDDIMSEVDGFTYTPAKVLYRGNPALEIGDVVSVEDRTGELKTCIISEHELVLTGMKGTISSKGGTEQESVMKQSPTEKKLKKMYNVMLNAFKDSTDKIIGAKGGYFVIDYDENGHSTGFRIMDTPTLTDNTKLWIYNKNGLGFSEDGGKTLKNVAIDMEGHINANVVNTGALVGEYFELNLDRGTLIMGERGSDGEFINKWLEVNENGLQINITEKVTVTDITPEYGKSNDTSVEPTEWYSTKPNISENEYLWMREIYTYSNGETKINEARIISAKDGQDAVLLQILSSNGHIFKNNLTSTTLTVEILVAGLRITSSRDMYSYFGENAKIVWQQKKQGETEYSDIDSSDPRLSDNAFIFTINTEDLKYETVYSCYLDC